LSVRAVVRTQLVERAAIQPYNNCYNYGCDYRTDTFAQPGRAAGAMYTAFSGASVRPAAVADALIASPNANNRCPARDISLRS
jgi:hypothetical protein